ncbi:MAG: eCIS core domain-containing protein, partial [Kofleriaceae bacterium]
MRGFAKSPAVGSGRKVPSARAAARQPVRAPAPPSIAIQGGRSHLDIPVFSPSPRVVAAQAFGAPGRPLPHLDRLERAFAMDLSGITAHIGGAASAATRRLGSQAFTVGERVAFRNSPDLRLAAHEAAHVVQQRHGLQLPRGEGVLGDPFERNADAIAARVVAGRSAVDLLPTNVPVRSGTPPIQHQKAVPTQLELDEYYLSILDEWEQRAASLPIGRDRAEARRVSLLLAYRPNFRSYDEVDTFLDECLVIAKDEVKTVERLKREPDVDESFFIAHGDAFPSWWADRVHAELHGTSDESQLAARHQAARKEALAHVAGISDELWDRGLPITAEQARGLVRSDIPRLTLDFTRARQFPKERLAGYTRLLVSWERTLLHLQLV